MPSVPTYAPNQVADDATLKGAAQALPSEDFGTGLVEGGQAVSDALAKQADTFDEAATQQLNVQYAAYERAQLYGPSGLFAKSGVNAVNAAPDAQQALQDERDRIIGQATTQRQRAMLTDTLNARLNSSLTNIDSFTTSQTRDWAKSSNAASVLNEQQDYSTLQAINPDEAQRHFDAMVHYAKMGNAYAGGDGSTEQLAVLQATSAAHKAVIQNMVTTDPHAAAIYEAAHAGEMDSGTRAEMASLVNSAYNSKGLKDAWDNYVAVGGASQATHPPAIAAAGPGAAGSAAYLANVRGHEGTTPDPNSSAQRGFINSTWLSTLKTHPEFAADIAGKTDAQLLQLRATDPDLADRATLALGRDSAAQLARSGIAPTSSNVFLMQWFGPGDGPKVIRSDPNASITTIISPATAAKNGLTGKTVGQVVAGVQHRFGNAPFNTTAGAPTTAPDGTTGAGSGVAALPDLESMTNDFVAKYADPNIPGSVEAAKTLVFTQWHEMKREADQRGQEAVNAAQGALQDPTTNKDWNAFAAAVGPQVLANLPPTTVTAYQRIIERNAKSDDATVTDLPTYAYLTKKSVGDPHAFTSIDLTDPVFADHLSKEDWKKFVDMQRSIAKGDAPKPGTVMTVQSAMKIASDQLATIGVTEKTAPKAVGQFQGALTRTLEDFRSGHGREPTGDEIIKASDALLIAGHWKTGEPNLFGDGMTHGRAFTAPAGAPFTPDIPDADRARITRDFTAHFGHAPGPADINSAYYRGIAAGIFQVPAQVQK